MPSSRSPRTAALVAIAALALGALGLVLVATPASAGSGSEHPDAAGMKTVQHCGDLNGDGIANSLDSLLVLQYVAGLLQTLDPPQNADADGNGRIDARDVALILQVAAHRLHIGALHCPPL